MPFEQAHSLVSSHGASMQLNEGVVGLVEKVTVILGYKVQIQWK